MPLNTNTRYSLARSIYNNSSISTQQNRPAESEGAPDTSDNNPGAGLTQRTSNPSDDQELYRVSAELLNTEFGIRS